MKLKVYSVFDSKASMYWVPFFSLNRGTAIRSFTDMASDETSSLFKHPMDYSLFEIGNFDDVTASFESEKPVNLGLASVYLSSRMGEFVDEFSKKVKERKVNGVEEVLS